MVPGRVAVIALRARVCRRHRCQHFSLKASTEIDQRGNIGNVLRTARGNDSNSGDRDEAGMHVAMHGTGWLG
jgi:hypothetical protein